MSIAPTTSPSTTTPPSRSGDGLSVVSAYLPGAAADAVVGASLFSQMGDVDLLPAWGGALVLLGYAAALTLAGRLATFARDVV